MTNISTALLWCLNDENAMVKPIVIEIGFFFGDNQYQHFAIVCVIIIHKI